MPDKPLIKNMDETELANVGSNKMIYQTRAKRARKTLRKKVGYTEAEPEMCKNCKHYQGRLNHRGEFFPARCLKHLFGVKDHAVCEQWEEV